MDPFSMGIATVVCCLSSSSIIGSGVAALYLKNANQDQNKFPQPEEEDFSLSKKKTLIAAREILKSADVIESEPPDGIKGRFIRISNPHMVCLHIANVIVSTNKNDNLAYQKPVTISSLIDRSEKFKPSNATDNDNNTYTHTSCGEPPWIIVDLQFVADITKIIIVNRQDCCQQRINGTIVAILGEDHETLWESEPFYDQRGDTYPISDSNLNQFGFDSFVMEPPETTVKGERNRYA